MAVITVQAGVAQHQLRAEPDEAARSVGHVLESSREVLDEFHVMVGVLRAEPNAGVALKRRDA